MLTRHNDAGEYRHGHSVDDSANRPSQVGRKKNGSQLMSVESAFRTSRYEIQLSGELGTFEASFRGEQISDGVEVVTLRLVSAIQAVPKELLLEWRHPLVDTHAMWTPSSGRNRGLVPSRASVVTSQATSGAPVRCLYNLEGRNRLTYGASDAMHVIEDRCGVYDEKAELVCQMRLFSVAVPATCEYEIRLRLDTRDIAYHESLKDVSDWWASFPDMIPGLVPPSARMPMYSTWYSMHQDLVAEQIESQCRIAKEIGCETVIIDDGWQTTDSSRGFGYCGDWKSVRIPQMKEHVQRLHEMGMKVILWYSVPHVGRFSEAFKRFEQKQLFYHERHKAGCFDPRFPDVREYLINIYEQAIREWDLDGFKLDFLDWFTLPDMQSTVADIPGRDYLSVPEAIDRLLTDAVGRLRAVKPDVMIEFRQGYVGPLMRKHGSMFRATDCPNAALTNRLRVFDVRLLCGKTAAHADPIQWNVTEPVESAALQMIHTLFGVPQVSMLLDKLPAAHLEMVRFWLRFWREHRDVILDGQLCPLYPHAMFPAAIASTPAKRLIAVYEPWVIRPGPDVPAELLIVNGTQGDEVVLHLAKGIGKRRVEVFDCRGRRVVDESTKFDEGLYMLPVPPSGLIRCTRLSTVR